MGTPILKVDLKALREAGYDTITPVLVTNSMDYAEVTAMEEKEVASGETIIKII